VRPSGTRQCDDHPPRCRRSPDGLRHDARTSLASSDAWSGGHGSLGDVRSSTVQRGPGALARRVSAVSNVASSASASARPRRSPGQRHRRRSSSAADGFEIANRLLQSDGATLAPFDPGHDLFERGLFGERRREGHAPGHSAVITCGKCDPGCCTDTARSGVADDVDDHVDLCQCEHAQRARR